MTRTHEHLPRRIGRYVLHRELASGGMATVYVGQLLGPVGFSRMVAIKRMHEEYASDRKFVAMFVDEAWLAARVQHPNVVSTVDVVADAGELFIVMEYIRGESLSSVLKTVDGPLPTPIAASIIAQILGGLHAAHEAKDEAGRALGMIHRDTSPQNILVGTDGLARLTDFGIAKAASRLQVTQTKEIKGKLRYMPPEQIVSDDKLDRRADIYASGVVLWEALAGRHLFGGESVDQVVRSILQQVPERFSQTRADVPVALDDVIAKATARQASARFGSAEEFQIAIERAVPLASSRAIGEWLLEVAGPSLRDKKASIDLIEQALSSHRGVTGELEHLSAPETIADPVVVPRSQATTIQANVASSLESTDSTTNRHAPVAARLGPTITINDEATTDTPPVGFEETAAAQPAAILMGAFTVLPGSAVPSSDEVTTRRGNRGPSATIALKQVQDPPTPYPPASIEGATVPVPARIPQERARPAPEGQGGSDEDATVRSAVPTPKQAVQWTVPIAPKARFDVRTQPSSGAPPAPSSSAGPRARERASPLRVWAPYVLLGLVAGGGVIAASSWLASDRQRRERTSPPVSSDVASSRTATSSGPRHGTPSATPDQAPSTSPSEPATVAPSTTAPRGVPSSMRGGAAP